MREIRLYGELGKKFGRVHHFDVKSPSEAICALKANFKEFTKYLHDHRKAGFHVFVGKRDLTRDELDAYSGNNVIKIVPAIDGAGKGVFQTILGIVLIVVGVVFENPTLVKMGFVLALGGVAQMLAKAPTSDATERPDNMPSYTFNGPVNTSAQGNAVSIFYGELIVGSQVISAGLSVDQIAIQADPVSPTPIVTPWNNNYGGTWWPGYEGNNL